MLYNKYSFNRRSLWRQRSDHSSWVHQGSSYLDKNKELCRNVGSKDIPSLLMTSSFNNTVNLCFDWSTTWPALPQLSLRLLCFSWPVFFFFAQMNAAWISCSLLSCEEKWVYIHKVQLQVHQTRGTRSFVKSLTTGIPITPKWRPEREVFLV